MFIEVAVSSVLQNGRYVKWKRQKPRNNYFFKILHPWSKWKCQPMY